MLAKNNPPNITMPHQLFHGTTWHSRLLPNVHKFAYPYRYWGVNISALAAGQSLPEVALLTKQQPIADELASPKINTLKSKIIKSRLFNNKILQSCSLFSATHKAVQQFCPEDYLQSVDENDNSVVSADMSNGLNTEPSANSQLLTRLTDIFIEKTGSAPIGDMLGLVVCRNAGIYFSPVNFYLGFDSARTPTHLLAEVSNTPWDKRHYYGFLLDGADSAFCHDKNFHVSPFNPIDQQYCWQVNIDSGAKRSVIKDQIELNNPKVTDKTQSLYLQDCLKVRIAINISDVRGEVLKTGVKVTGIPMTAETVRQSLQQNPLMNVTSLTRIYWHAFKLYALKKVPYVGYDEKLAASKQNKTL